MAATPTLSSVIPTYRRREVLARTLPMLLHQRYPAEQYELVIVVGASEDGTLEMLRKLRPKCGLTVIDQRPNGGQAEAKNIGIGQARGEFVLVLDDDVICDENLVASHMELHQHCPNPAVVFGPVLVHESSPPTIATLSIRAWTDEYMRDLEARQGIPRFPHGIWINSNCSVLRQQLLEAGGFDPTMRISHDDADLAITLWKRGVCFRYQPKAVTCQLYVKTTDTLIMKDAHAAGRNSFVLSRKHPEYRPYSIPAGIGGGKWPLLKQAAIRSPISPQPLLQIASHIAERGTRSHRLPLQLFRARVGVEALRSAYRQSRSWQEFEAEFGLCLPVLMYHHVGAAADGVRATLSITPKQFSTQVSWLKDHGYTGICARDWLAWCREGARLPSKPVLITFDDAYADIAEHALPVIERAGFGCTVYVVTGHIGGTNNWDGDVYRVPLMTAEQIRTWAVRGMEFGSHTHSHADLTLSAVDFAAEITRSGDELAELVEREVVSFAYPYGRYSDAVREAVEERFPIAFGVLEGMNTLRTDLSCLRRTMVKPTESLFEFGLRVRWGSNPLERLAVRTKRAITWTREERCAPA